MCLPMAPAGPDREVMKPIFTVSATAGAAAMRLATNATTTARWIRRTATSLPLRVVGTHRERSPPEIRTGILAEGPAAVQPRAPSRGAVTARRAGALELGELLEQGLGGDGLGDHAV